MGQYNGQGILYNPETGNVVGEGEFRNGELITPKVEETTGLSEEDNSDGEAMNEQTVSGEAAN
ncbi:MAG: hypothetical protein LUE96_02950 [Lachnospiraceae bacterium]|nr:hypothetical protein [Lachnospiraceae bacterium]